jgi:hypothetical protein
VAVPGCCKSAARDSWWLTSQWQGIMHGMHQRGAPFHNTSTEARLRSTVCTTDVLFGTTRAVLVSDVFESSHCCLAVLQVSCVLCSWATTSVLAGRQSVYPPTGQEHS